MPQRYPNLRARLLANSEPVLVVPHLGPCRVWTGELNSSGYGVVNMRVRRLALYSVNGKLRKHRKIKKALAHRVSLADASGVRVWQLNNVCHECDNRACIEPAHLRSKSQRANIKDCIARGRHNGFENRQERQAA